eukprot:scaffold9.g3117.t1
MQLMKVMPCPKCFVHEWSECPFSHPHERAKRRDPSLHAYTGIACPAMRKASEQGREGPPTVTLAAGACTLGDHCPYAHNAFEYWLHPTRRAKTDAAAAAVAEAKRQASAAPPAAQALAREDSLPCFSSVVAASQHAARKSLDEASARQARQSLGGAASACASGSGSPHGVQSPFAAGAAVSALSSPPRSPSLPRDGLLGQRRAAGQAACSLPPGPAAGFTLGGGLPTPPGASSIAPEASGCARAARGDQAAGGQVLDLAERCHLSLPQLQARMLGGLAPGQQPQQAADSLGGLPASGAEAGTLAAAMLQATPAPERGACPWPGLSILQQAGPIWGPPTELPTLAQAWDWSAQQQATPSWEAAPPPAAAASLASAVEPWLALN